MPLPVEILTCAELDALLRACNRHRPPLPSSPRARDPKTLGVKVNLEWPSGSGS